MKIGSNMDINRDRKKFAPPVVPKAVISADRHEPVEITIPHSLKMLIKIIMIKSIHYTFDFRDWFNCLSFLVENKWHHYYLQSVVLW